MDTFHVRQMTIALMTHIGDRADHVVNRSFGAGGGGGKESRRAVVEVSPAGGGYGIGSSIHEVRTGPPMDMDIDVTGCDVRTGRIDRLRTAWDAFGHGGDFGNLSGNDFDIRVVEQCIG